VRVARERSTTPMFIGSADALRSGLADVVLANIDAPTLERIAGQLERIRKPNSTLILTGFPHWDPPQGFHPREVLRRDEWLCWVC